IDQINLSDRFQLLLGARYDHIEFDNRVSGIERTNNELSPMVGAVFSATDSLTFYANAGEAFALPSTFVIDDTRKPEESRQVEVGAKKSFRGGRIHSSLAAFRIDRENIAIPDDFGIPRQTGDQRSDGLELELFGTLGKGIRGNFTYAYTDSELTEFTETVLVGFFPPTFATVDRSGNSSPFAPEHLATLWLSKTFDNGFGIAGGGRYVSDQFIAEDNAFEIGSYVTFDAAVFYDLSAWRLQLSLQNLTDEEYFT
ncbi:MAG: TonB-dependent receptor, partial [Acidobacteria bacterium]|nr:TonB-dependent receptor [Acidobacteriota bacterium]